MLFLATYYLFPREIGVSVDQPTRMAYNEILGTTSESDQEILAHGFDVRFDIIPGDQLHVTRLKGLPLRPPTNPAWFNSKFDTVVAFLLPLLTALAGMWLFRFLFPTLERADAAAGTTGVQPGPGNDGGGRTDAGRQIVRFSRTRVDSLADRLGQPRGNLARPQSSLGKDCRRLPEDG